jgi:hypothetical protein
VDEASQLDFDWKALKIILMTQDQQKFMRVWSRNWITAVWWKNIIMNE